jgi:uncharacterized membrane protein
MDDLTIARAIHVVGVVFWIGGVAFVTTVLLPGSAALKIRKIECRSLNESRGVLHGKLV